MPEDDKEPRHFIDLEETEWSSDEKHEPFFGPEAGGLFIMFLAGFPIAALATLLVTGELPYWLRHLLQ